jgi:hypothetical protein
VAQKPLPDCGATAHPAGAVRLIFQNVSIQSHTSQPHLIKRKRPSENFFRRPLKHLESGKQDGSNHDSTNNQYNKDPRETDKQTQKAI